MMDESNNDHVFKAATNWTLAGGSLTDSISFDDGSISAAVDDVAKSPLLLLPPIHEDEPCEITITFAQEHELRQIYIRSSARVYEVYYTKNRRHDREYLCTVRCGIAIREDEVLQIPLTELASPKNRVEQVKDNGNGRTNEDDWVEVKSADTSLLNNGKDQLGKQDCFEATAEINDAEPCISVTLRLLSLQDKRCALVGEVYVFADHIDQSDSEKEANGTGNSSSSALMAMFMPALMQLSRGKNDRKLPDKSNSTNPETLGNSNGSDKMQQETNFSKADHMGASSPVLVDTLAKRVDSATRVSEAEMKPAISCNNMETILYQLVNKVNSIETILTRFEDQMLKPINSIDARLQLVERKVEELSKKSYESEKLFETKAPNTDCLDRDTGKTLDTDELDEETSNTDDPKLESCMNIVIPELSSIINSEECAVVQSTSGNEMISAESEISKDEVDHSFERGSKEEKPKRSVSINDALASALAGLLSSTSIMDRKYSKALVVTAPEFPNEDNMEIEEKPHTSTPPDKSQVVAEEFGNTYSALDTPTSTHIEDHSNGVSENLDDGDDAETVVSVINGDFEDETVTSRTKPDCHEPSNPETKLEKPNLTVLKSVLGFEPTNSSIDILSHVLDDDGQTVVSARNDDLDEETVTSRTKPDCHEPSNPETELEKPNLTVLKSVFGFEPINSSIDFLSPVLDVEFKSEKKVSDNNCFFETLLTTQSKTVVDCNKDDSNGVSEILNDGDDGETVVSVRNDDLDEEAVTSKTKPNCHEPSNPETELEKPKSVLGFEPIDFLTPVLEVEFKSEKKVSDNNCFFETLFTTESKTVVDCSNGEAFDDRLVSMQDEELIGPPTDTLSSLEIDYYETNELHLQFNGELSTASLI